MWYVVIDPWGGHESKQVFELNIFSKIRQSAVIRSWIESVHHGDEIPKNLPIEQVFFVILSQRLKVVGERFRQKKAIGIDPIKMVQCLTLFLHRIDPQLSLLPMHLQHRQQHSPQGLGWLNQ